jgi:hypothetical protein
MISKIIAEIIFISSSRNQREEIFTSVCHMGIGYVQIHGIGINRIQRSRFIYVPRTPSAQNFR